MRCATEKEYTHERLGERFRTALSDYDTQARLEVLVDRFLNQKLSGRTVQRAIAETRCYRDRHRHWQEHAAKNKGNHRLPV
jgi:hypothetical protein